MPSVSADGLKVVLAGANLEAWDWGAVDNRLAWSIVHDCGVHILPSAVKAAGESSSLSLSILLTKWVLLLGFFHWISPAQVSRGLSSVTAACFVSAGRANAHNFYSSKDERENRFFGNFRTLAEPSNIDFSYSGKGPQWLGIKKLMCSVGCTSTRKVATFLT